MPRPLVCCALHSAQEVLEEEGTGTAAPADEEPPATFTSPAAIAFTALVASAAASTFAATSNAVASNATTSDDAHVAAAAS